MTKDNERDGHMKGRQDDKYDYEAFETATIQEDIMRCEDLEQFKEEVLTKLHTQKKSWLHEYEKIEGRIRELGYTKGGFAEMCGVSRMAMSKWSKGAIPKRRETFMRIGMALGYDIDQINSLITGIGQYPKLYSKNPEDCICMFVVSNYEGAERIQKYIEILNIFKEEIKGSTEVVDNVTTEKFDAKLAEVKDESEMRLFLEDNLAMFSNAYKRFCIYMSNFIKWNYLRSDAYPFRPATVNELAEEQGWSSSLRQCVSAINQGRWYPTRNKIISLGLHLSIQHEDIDDLLGYAHMEPLYAKNIFESVIIFILEDASLRNIMNRDSDDYDPDGLLIYAKRILTQLDLPEIDAFISEISEVYDE